MNAHRRTGTKVAALSHLDDEGAARMVDVGGKPVSRREATAEGVVRMNPRTVRLIQQDQIAKGNVLAVARIAGILAAKQTAALIPLCHPLPLTSVEIDFEMLTEGVKVKSSVRTIAVTGVEMEALTAVAVAGLTIYDMCKAADKLMTIEAIRLVSKKKAPVEAHPRAAPMEDPPAQKSPRRKPVAARPRQR